MFLIMKQRAAACGDSPDRRHSRRSSMTRLIPAALAAALAVAACAQHERVGGDTRVDSVGQADRADSASASRTRPALPQVELTEQLMFKLMMAEVALQRGQPQIAIPALLELARETRDPRLARRATEAAWTARYTDAALEAAGLWLQTDPGSARARQVLAALLVNEKQLDAARKHFEQWLASDRENVGQNFLQLSTLLSRNTDRKSVFELMRSLAQPYQKVPEARLAVAQAAWNAGNESVALSEASAALKLRPDWELAALFQAQALQRRSNDEALAFLGEYLKAHPQAKDTRLNYARLLVTAKRYPEARKQFDALLEQFPGNPDVAMAVALLAIQANDLPSAEKQLQHALESGYGEPDVARVYLGQISEEQQRYDEALKWYGSVEPGEQYINAQARYAGVLAKEGRLGDARKHLQQVSTQDAQQRVQLTQAEAQLLRDANDYQGAFDLLGQSLQKMPDNPDLLYDYAMAAEKVNKVDVLERSLRKLIELRPDHAHAYNALGYTFADRNERLPEAYGLIEQALKLSPNDAFIMDSMGWVLFRMGRNQEATDYLQRAYNTRPDGDIAAHLGEVLWAQGRQDEARRLWADALKENAQNEALQNAIKRHAPVSLPVAR
jgi:tetratricopeptide (TPR) repeat protein